MSSVRADCASDMSALAVQLTTGAGGSLALPGVVLYLSPKFKSCSTPSPEISAGSLLTTALTSRRFLSNLKLRRGT